MTAQTDAILQLQASMEGLHRAVGELNGKVSTFIDQMKVQDERATTLTTRVNKVENRQYWMSGIGAALGALFTKYAPGLFGHA